MQDRTLAELERLVAHEAGHVYMTSREEELMWDQIKDRFEDHWTRALVAFAGVATDEYRAELDVYRLGYPVEEARTDAGIPEKLWEYSLMAMAAIGRYRNDHQDPETLQEDVLECLVVAAKYLATLAARHQGGHPIAPSALPEHGAENWAELVDPVWEGLLTHFEGVPGAGTPWPNDERLAAAIELSPQLDALVRCLGFQGEPEAIWVTLSDEEFEVRRVRMNVDAALYGPTVD